MNYELNAENFATKHGIKLDVNLFDYGFYFPNDKERRYIFVCTLSRGRKSYKFKFGQSIIRGCEEPTMYDVLACLQKYEVGTINDFCGDFGYDINDKYTKKIYNAVSKEYNAVERLFGDILEELQEIQ